MLRGVELDSDARGVADLSGTEVKSDISSISCSSVSSSKVKNDASASNTRESLIVLKFEGRLERLGLGEIGDSKNAESVMVHGSAGNCAPTRPRLT